MAVRVSDGFSILNGMAVGFVRAVAAEDAVHALLETERLQVVSHVSALSSPVFNNKDLEVRYVAHGGAGLGMAWFTGSGACVVAVCGPSEVSRVVEQAITDLRKSVVLLEVPKREGVEEDKAEEKVAESVTTHDCSIQ